MKYTDGRTPEPPAKPWHCKHCSHYSDTLSEAFIHVKNAHGIDPFAPIPYPPIERQGAA